MQNSKSILATKNNIIKKKKILNILIFPGGTEIGMEIGKALRYCKEVNVFSVSSSVKNHAPYLYNNHFNISDVYSAEWVFELNNIIEAQHIDYIFPANAFVIDALSKNRDQIKTKIILNDNNILKVVRSKTNTCNLFEGVIPLPKFYRDVEDVDVFPVFIKPDNAYGSQGAEVINDESVLLSRINNGSDYVIQEYLPGDEYTIDCFCNTDVKLLYCQGRTRERIRMGTSMHSELVSQELNEYFNRLATIILSKLPIKGCWFFQMKRDREGVLRLLEIEARVAGTMALSRARGINFPLLSIMNYEGFSVNIMYNEIDISIDRALINKYHLDIQYDTVYIDLDDTIIVHQNLNLEIIKFLFQCINRKIPIILISKCLHENIQIYLEEYKILSVFDQIIWLKEQDKKSEFINTKTCKPIYIDDSFSQRREVAEKLCIPTFDPSMVEALIEDKI